MPLRLLDSASGGAVAARSRAGQRQFQRPEPPTADAVGGVRFWRPLPRKALDVVCGEGLATSVPLHAHEAVQVLLPTSRFVVSGGAGRASVVRPGVVHVTAPLELRGMRSLDGAPFGTRILLVSPASLPHASLPFAELVVDDPDVYAELTALFDALRRPLVEAQCQSRLAECLARLIARYGETGSGQLGSSRSGSAARPPAGVVRARDYLRARAVERVTLDELAGVAGLSKFYLLRAFYRAYGLTPHAYQMQLRLGRARRLLAEGRPLSHVTYDAGFADQSHLTRRFAEFYRLTPARYARQLVTPPGDARPAGASADRAATPPSAA